jgi:hypothetical protein
MKLTQEELESIRKMNAEFSGAKLALGDIEIKKHSILKQIDEMKLPFELLELDLIQKYGKDAIIDINTGEVTFKE